MKTLDIIQKLNSEYFDYQKLTTILEGESHVRRKICQLIRDGAIVAVKKGLYILGDKIRGTTYSREVLANLVYGPSYISLEFALSLHGLIPEKVSIITSVTLKRNNRFDTPVGTFSYEHLHFKAYPWGISRAEISKNAGYLIATPEKALLDLVALRIKTGNRRRINFEDYLFNDLRIDVEAFGELNLDKIYSLSRYYKNIFAKEFGIFCKERNNNHG